MKNQAEKIIIDAKGVSFGRLASQLSHLLLGKDKPGFSPAQALDRKIEVININEVKITGKKGEKKIYYRHTGYPGGIKKDSFASRMEKNPGEALKKSIYKMLPNNRLRKKRIKNLIVK